MNLLSNVPWKRELWAWK